MKLGIDLRALQVGHQFRGIGMVVSNFIEELSQQLSDTDTVVFYYFKTDQSPLGSLRINKDFKYEVRELPRRKSTDNPYKKLIIQYLESLKTRFSRNPVGDLNDIEVFLQFDVGLGVPRSNSVRTVVFCYDLIPLVMPNEYLPSPITFTLQHSWKQGARAYVANSIYKRGLKGYKRANNIIAISNQTKTSLVELLGISKGKITVAHLALPKIEKAIEESEIDSKIIELATSKTPYVLFVGGIDPRRRIDELIAAYNNVRASGQDLAVVIAGKEFDDPDNIPNEDAANAINDSSYGDGINLFGFISNREKAYLFENALAFVYPTRYEGFGLPILEGMASSCPVITYKNSSIPEVGGDAAMYADDFEDISNHITNLSASTALHEKYVNLGLKQAKLFSWKKTVQDVLKVL